VLHPIKINPKNIKIGTSTVREMMGTIKEFADNAIPADKCKEAVFVKLLRISSYRRR